MDIIHTLPYKCQMCTFTSQKYTVNKTLLNCKREVNISVLLFIANLQKYFLP